LGQFSYPSHDYFPRKGVLLGLYANQPVGDLLDQPIKTCAVMERSAPRQSDASQQGRMMFHLEGGKENRPKAVKIQLRPNPLAR
jgi:hypothetical protein